MVEGKFVEADFILRDVCWCFLGGFAVLVRCLTILQAEVAKNRWARWIEEWFQRRDRGSYDADVYFEATMRYWVSMGW